jgi:Cof subfamily protein (haloacid dehalogenase superfamily)
MRPRLLATDLDGTLLRPEPPISSRVTDALAAAQAAGVVVVLVTARNWRSVRGIADEAGVGGLAICSNGAVVYDLGSGVVTRSQALDLRDVRAFLDRCRTIGDLAIAWETAVGAYRTPRYHALAMRDPNFSAAYLSAIEIVDDIADHHEITKLLVRHETLAAGELLALVASIGHPVTATVSGGRFVEITAPGVTKAFALAAVCAELGIERSDVVAVGDQPNDLPMLQWAGRGVAMGNAHPEVLAAITERTATNLEDGLALVIEHFLA